MIRAKYLLGSFFLLIQKRALMIFITLDAAQHMVFSSTLFLDQCVDIIIKAIFEPIAFFFLAWCTRADTFAIRKAVSIAYLIDGPFVCVDLYLFFCSHNQIYKALYLRSFLCLLHQSRRCCHASSFDSHSSRFFIVMAISQSFMSCIVVSGSKSQ